MPRELRLAEISRENNKIYCGLIYYEFSSVCNNKFGLYKEYCIKIGLMKVAGYYSY